MITQEKLKKLLHYDPETGIFTRLISTQGKKKNSIAGAKTNLGYIKIIINKKPYLAHRLAWLYMTGEWPVEDTDHIDHVRDNNRWNNLREVSRSENLKNQSMRKSNSSGITGVSWNKLRDKWKVQINLDGVRKTLLQSKDFFEACCVRKSAENRYGFHANHGRN
ncbi:MAG: HNH endonuclease [Candidatus Aminicenantes bacterium]|nr:HNH endonuclease [Candidatus Aminicenantes bacterium]